jgi:hypothetical protein
VKDNLAGRTVGYSYPYFLHPSHIEPDGSAVAETTKWARVIGIQTEFADMPDTYVGTSVHTGAEVHFNRTSIHTVMPESYR